MSTEFKFTVSQKRKHPALRINDNGVLEFLAPVGFPYSAAEKLVSQNSELIFRLRKRHEKISEKKLQFCDGMSVYFYGKQYPVHFTQRAKTFLPTGFFIPGGTEEKIRSALAGIYKEEAMFYLPARTRELAERFGIKVKSVSIGSAVGRWGSCKRDGSIRYSWRLLQCEKNLIDYIIIHELAHRLVFDHSAEFWKRVEQMLPGSVEYKRKLREFSQKNGLL